MPFETTKRHAHLISHSEGDVKIDETEEPDTVPSSKRQVPSHPPPAETEKENEKEVFNTADRQVPSHASQAEKDDEVSKTVNTSGTSPRIHQNFQRRFFRGMLWNADVYSPSSAGASVRFYPYATKNLSHVSHLFAADNVSDPTDVPRHNQGALGDFVYRATFVLPKLNNPGDVQMVLNMARAAIRTTIPQEHLVDFKYLNIPPPLPMEVDSSVLLLQFVNEKDDKDPEAKKSKINSLLDIGFRIVGKINEDPSSSSLRDFTADVPLLIGDSAIIFEAKLKTLLATPTPADGQDLNSIHEPAFAFEFDD